jgi:hypothetical protein
MKSMTKGWLRHSFTVAAALLVVGFAATVWADPPVDNKPQTSPGHGVPVPRGIPDMIAYGNFDPPKSSLFDISRFTISGDMRVRPEYRSNQAFGLNSLSAGGVGAANNQLNSAQKGVQQWYRVGLNYAISPDVDTFLQMQYAHNWGGAAVNGGNPNSNDPNALPTLGVRQAYMIIRNIGIQGLSLKAGRQLIVMGNHRLFGHFDWSNTGFSHDGITLQYSQPTYELWGGWLRPADLANSANGGQTSLLANGTACAAPPGTCNSSSAQTNILFTRVVLKPVAGLSLEPLWVYFDNNQQSFGGTGFAGNTVIAHAPNQQRHTMGGRVAYRQGMFDGTLESYWQRGSMGLASSANRLQINAMALAAEGGITFKDAPWSPRLGLEFNYASGDGNANRCNSSTGAACNGHANTFENLYPTNHIVMGYADRMAWRNMVGYSGSAQFIPTNSQHLEFRFWVFRKANSQDCWYTASQACFSTANTSVGGAQQFASSNSLYKELDVIHTLYFMNNKVGWQTGGGYLWAGNYVNQLAAGNAAATGSSAVNSIWAYTQLHVNF